MKKAFDKETVSEIIDMLTAARTQAIREGRCPDKTTDKGPKTERDRIKAEKADLFARRYSVLAALLGYSAQSEFPGFETYVCETEAQRNALNACRRFAQRLLDRVVDGKNPQIGLLLCGTCGTGKTHLAHAILRELQKQGAPGYAIGATSYFDLFTSAFNGHLDAPLPKIIKLFAGVSCLVIDDVGTAAWTDARRDRLQQILDLREAQRLPTVITTNLKKSDLDMADRLKSRFSGLLYPVVATWEDYRETHSVRNRTPEEVF